MARKRPRKNPPVTAAVTTTGDGDGVSKRKKLPPVASVASATASSNAVAATTTITTTAADATSEATDAYESFVPSHQVNYMGHVLDSRLLVHGGKQNIESASGKNIDLFTNSNTKEDFNSLPRFQLTNPRQQTPSDDTTKSILFLEEQVKIHEATLRAWSQRREAILIEKEATLAMKRELIDTRTNVIERQRNLESARSKHLVLQAELKESLAMSRDKLKRLVMLETEGEKEENHTDADSDSDGRSQFSETNQASSEASLELSVDEVTAGRDAEGQNTLAQNLAKSGYPMDENQDKFQFPVMFDSYKNAKELSRYHISTEARKHFSLLGFLPYLDSCQVGEYLILMQRETYALDQEDGGGRERSLRRLLFQNTCLDVLLLALPKKDNDNKQFAAGAYSDATPQFFDPNISLCPYELAGICADDLCPYQHTTKATKILARERLPLPSLPLSFLSVEWPTIENKAVKNSTATGNKREAVMEKADSDLENQHRQNLPPPARELPFDSDGDNSGEEEDFIMLPTSRSPNDNENENDIGNPESDAGGGEDLILLPSPNNDTKDGNNNDENESTSNGICSNPEDSDGNLQKRVPSLCKPLTGLDCESVNTMSFWWGGKLPKYVGGNTVSKDSKRTSLSILDILEDTFGLAIHEYPSMTMAGKEDRSNSTERRIEIKTAIASNRKDQKESELLDAVNALGQVLDASRLAMHGGLHDVVLSLDQKEEIFRHLINDEILQDVAYSLLDHTGKSRFFDQYAPSLSCFENSFATQVGLAIRSWYLAAYGKALYGKTKEEQRKIMHIYAHNLESACVGCFHDPSKSNTDAQFETLDTVELEKYLRNSYFSEVQEEIDHNTIKSLRSLILWCQSNLIPYRKELDASDTFMEDAPDTFMEERLNSIWLVAKRFLWEHRKDESGGDSRQPIDSLEEEFRCLKVIILIGYTISGCLSNFAYAAVSTRRTESDNGEGILGSKLSASSRASWTLLDGAIARVLKDMRRLLIGFPLLDLVIAPLCAYSVASSSYLRNYSTAQNRLIECLSGNHRCSGDSSVHSSTNLMMYSELLWSQLVQLRMSLPNEPPKIASVSILGSALIPNGNKVLVKRDAANYFPWEPSKTLREENRQFIAKLKSLEIRLRHVVLWGDWLLSSLTEKNGSSQTLLRLFSKNPKESKLSRNSAETSIQIQWGCDLEKLFGKTRCNNRITANNSAEELFGSRCYPPPTPLPQIPLFLLHAGRFLTDLNLKGCYLEKLPLAFGLYFPNLRNLDLSNNDLKELPESLHRLTHRMKFLEIFSATHNRLESLPPDMLSATSSKQSTLNSQLPLRILALSHNELVSLPSLAGLDHLEALSLQHNALVDMSIADWSNLALRLPSLRILKREGQAKR